MKVYKFILAGVAVLGLGMTACNNDDVHLYYERCHDQGGK